MSLNSIHLILTKSLYYLRDVSGKKSYRKMSYDPQLKPLFCSVLEEKKFNIKRTSKMRYITLNSKLEFKTLEMSLIFFQYIYCQGLTIFNFIGKHGTISRFTSQCVPCIVVILLLEDARGRPPSTTSTTYLLCTTTKVKCQEKIINNT